MLQTESSIHACGYELVGPVLARYRGLAVKLSELTTKAKQWWSSHGAEPKSQNPLSSGNKSAVDHYLRFARLYEAGAKGAGRMLNRRVYDALEAEFSEQDYREDEQPRIEVSVLKETCDVSMWLAKFDIPTANEQELVLFIDDCKEGEDSIATARSAAQVRLRQLRSGIAPRVASGNGAVK